MEADRYGRGADRLQGRVAVITGAGSRAEGIGNGRAAAILMARCGARVVLVDTQAEWAERTLQMVQDAGGEGLVVVADVSRQPDCERIAVSAIERFCSASEPMLVQ